MILVRSDLDFSVKSVNLDTEGRSIIMEAEVQGSLFLFVNIYAPNKVQDQCRFFENLNKNMEHFAVNKEHRIIVGVVPVENLLRKSLSKKYKTYVSIST